MKSKRPTQCFQDPTNFLFPKPKSSGPYPHIYFVVIHVEFSVLKFYTHSSYPSPNHMPSLSLLHCLSYTLELTKWNSVLFEKPIVSQPVKKFPAFLLTRMFITAFTTALICSYSEPNPVQTPHSISWKSIFNITLPSVPRSSSSSFCRAPGS